MKIKKAASCLLAAALLSACQPTPDVEPVAQKDSEALVERVEVAEEDVADMAKAPESRHITRELSEASQRTGIDITIDADVVLPETDALRPLQTERLLARRRGASRHGGNPHRQRPRRKHH